MIAGFRTSEATCPDRGCREADLHVQFLAEPASSGVKKPMFVSQASNYVECRKIATPGIDLQRSTKGHFGGVPRQTQQFARISLLN